MDAKEFSPASIIEGPILIADDEKGVQQALKFQFNGWFPGVETMCAENETTILTLCRTRPEVIVLDANLADCEGLQLISDIEKISPASKIVIFSGHVDFYNVYRASQTSARAFVGKDADAEDLRAAIVFAVGGRDKRVFRSWGAQFLYDRLKNDPRSFTLFLSERERELLGELGCGLSNDAIAERLGLSPKTVERHRSEIMKKLDLRTSADVILYALGYGFTRKPDGPGELRPVPPVGGAKKKYRTFLQGLSGVFSK